MSGLTDAKVEDYDGGVWTCKIGTLHAHSRISGADGPMRNAVEAAFKQVTGLDCDFTFSGWGGELTPEELDVVAREETVGS